MDLLATSQASDIIIFYLPLLQNLRAIEEFALNKKSCRWVLQKLADQNEIYQAPTSLCSEFSYPEYCTMFPVVSTLVGLARSSPTFHQLIAHQPPNYYYKT
jgi:hypothetical protein